MKIVKTDNSIFFDNRNLGWFKSLFLKDGVQPLLTYEKSYWYNDRYEVMGKNGAVPRICGWCGKESPAYPEGNGLYSASCHECDRSMEDSQKDWIYRAEYSDGCKVVLFQGGYSSSQGVDSRSGYSGTHAPHNAFSTIEEIPVFEFINLKIFEIEENINTEELLSFFRHTVFYGNGFVEKNRFTNIIEKIKFKQFPKIQKKYDESWKGEQFDFSIIDLREDFDGNVFTAYLVPVNNPTKGNVLSSTLLSENRESALEVVLSNIPDNIDIESYNVFISNGSRLSMLDE